MTDREYVTEPLPLLDSRGYRRAPATLPGAMAGRAAPNRGQTLLPTLLKPEDVSSLVAACGSGPFGLRMQAFIALLYRTGAGLDEVLSLELADLDLTPAGESVAFKGGEMRPKRTLALDEAAVTLLNPWLEVRKTYPGQALLCVVEGPTRGRDWARNDARKRLGQLGKEVLNVRVHPQAFRFTLVAELMVEQWPLPHIQAQLGITGFNSFKKIFEYLGINRPPDEELMEISRFRPTWDAHAQHRDAAAPEHPVPDGHARGGSRTHTGTSFKDAVSAVGLPGREREP